VIDFAYQGFAEGIEEDARGARICAETCPELIVCSSFSKNFGLYRERVGAVTVAAATVPVTDAIASRINKAIRANYSNPPAHGGAIVETVLHDAELFGRWIEEVAAMRRRLRSARELLVGKLDEHGVPGNYAFLTQQRGMFSFTGLRPEQVDTLREKHAIYIVRSGRINVAGVSEENVDRLCRAIREVVDASASNGAAAN
jgi:aspartate/tyrosine/aromatic aminotransferase